MERITGVGGGYIPGTYARRTPNGPEMAEIKMREWERQRREQKRVVKIQSMPPAICISRKIAVGALEIADLVGESLGYRVVDREILEYIANRADLREKTVAFFDEKYPGRTAEFITLIFGEKSFIKSDYARHLAETAFSMANLEPTIFVGRGTHLLLPRDQVLAVRFICGQEKRVQRLFDIMGMDTATAEKELKTKDKEQRGFFKRVFGKNEASPYEFDLVINRDHIASADNAAAIVLQAFKEKFDRPAQ